ncbi:MAG: hypothetical protein GW893_16880 [Armatimonadetes bacterium]|nr:hypothetical protein [Armatimonadota bacterium]PIY40185.1 MAG: hypothetical protein COZ05_18065 [Armatimonadetes bacterium CG_4_10_14_3_um_filter_59_10]
MGNSNFGTLTGQDGICWLHHAMPDNAWMNLAYRFNMAPASIDEYIRTVGALFLWDRPFGTMPDLSSLPRTKWFPDGGVFMRSGWEFQDLAFWLKTQQYQCTTGKHEDYGSFYLHAYGEPFAAEGAGKVESSAVHNLVFIDGKCMDRGSYDVMPSAPLVDLVAGDFASAAIVDQKEAYSEDTYFEGPERTLVSKPLNPVQKAQRIGCVVWGGRNVGPYVLIVDDIDKDGQPHDYRWQMLLNPNHTVQEKQGEERWVVARDKLPAETFYPPAMDVALLSPIGKITPIPGNAEKKDSPRLVIDANAVNPRFAVCLYPRRPGQPTVWGMPELSVVKHETEGGFATVLKWPECVDRVVVSYGGGVEVAGIQTNARLVVVRTALPSFGSGAPYGEVIGALMVQGTGLLADGRAMVNASAISSISAHVNNGRSAIGIFTKESGLRLGFPVVKPSRS